MIIVDFQHTVISAVMAEMQGKKLTIDVKLVRHIVINCLRSYKAKFGHEFGEMIIACDTSSNWRKAKFSYYKSHRKKDRDDSGIDWDTIFKTLNEIKKEIDLYFPYTILEVDMAEADDIIATLTKWNTEHNLKPIPPFDFHEEPEPLLIVSGDKDFKQLHKYRNVKQYAPVQKKFITPEYSVPEFLMRHIINGDKGDGIPNILSADDTFASGGRQGKVTAKKLDVWLKFTPDNFHEQEPNKEIVRNFQRNRTIIDFDLIPQDVQDAILEKWNNRVKKDRSKLLSYFMKNGMGNLLENVTDF